MKDREGQALAVSSASTCAQACFSGDLIVKPKASSAQGFSIYT